MENIKKCTNETIKKLFEKLTYGTNLIEFSDENCKNTAEKLILLMNEINTGSVSISPAYEGGIDHSEGPDKGQFVEVPIEGVYNVIWRDKSTSPPILKDDDLRISELAEGAAASKSEVVLNISPELNKMAKKAAFANGIKFRTDGNRRYFNAVEKKQSMAKKIEQSYRLGHDKIEFTPEEMNIATARVYASNLGSVTGEKFRVSGSNGKITILFREVADRQGMSEKIKMIFAECLSQFGQSDTIDLFTDIIGPYLQPLEAIEPQTPNNIGHGDIAGHSAEDADTVVPLEVGADSQTAIPVPPSEDADF